MRTWQKNQPAKALARCQTSPEYVTPDESLAVPWQKRPKQTILPPRTPCAHPGTGPNSGLALVSLLAGWTLRCDRTTEVQAAEYTAALPVAFTPDTAAAPTHPLWLTIEADFDILSIIEFLSGRH